VIFRHLLYGAWPDHGVPEKQDRPSFLEFVRLVDRTNKDMSFVSTHQTSDGLEIDPDPPIIINCSAGVGRTGAFIALASLLRAHDRLSSSSSAASSPTVQFPVPSELPPSPLGSLPEPLVEDLIAQEIDSLREQRPSMVQRDEQVVFVYDVLVNSFSR
jgi:protein-tyrosine phosphatase